MLAGNKGVKYIGGRWWGRGGRRMQQCEGRDGLKGKKEVTVNYRGWDGSIL
jgi:hypothetical protein